MNLEEPEMTSRLLRALESPTCVSWGIPRAAFCFIAKRSRSTSIRSQPPQPSVACFLKSTRVPERLDLNGPLIRAAQRKGCRFTISTDAHQPRHLENMTYGVTMARRGWLEAKDVLNTLPLAQFEQAIRRIFLLRGFWSQPAKRPPTVCGRWPNRRFHFADVSSASESSKSLLP